MLCILKRKQNLTMHYIVIELPHANCLYLLTEILSFFFKNQQRAQQTESTSPFLITVN